METNLLIIILGIIGELALIVFFIKRNQKYKKDFMRELLEFENGSIPKEQNTEVDPAGK